MIGGEAGQVKRLPPLLLWRQHRIVVGDGWVLTAGHFAKMVHNGIEYSLMQAFAEGFSILHAKSDLIEDPAGVAELWRNGSVICSWLLDLIAAALAENKVMLTNYWL